MRDLVRCSVRLAADQVLLEADGLCYKALHLYTVLSWNDQTWKPREITY